MADHRLTESGSPQSGEAEVTEEQLIAEAFGQVKVLVEAGEQAGYLQLQPSEVHSFALASYEDVLVEKLGEADLQEVSKWGSATQLGPLINLIEPQDEQQLGQIQIDPITGERYMLVPIEINILVDCEKLCNLFDMEAEFQKQQQRQKEFEKESQLDQEKTPREEPQKNVQKEQHEMKTSKKASSKKSLRERFGKWTQKKKLQRESQKKQLQGESQKKQLQKEKSQSQSLEQPQENRGPLSKDEALEQTLKESQYLDCNEMVVVPPIIFSFKGAHKNTKASSKLQHQQEEV